MGDVQYQREIAWTQASSPVQELPVANGLPSGSNIQSLQQQQQQQQQQLSDFRRASLTWNIPNTAYGFHQLQQAQQGSPESTNELRFTKKEQGIGKRKYGELSDQGLCPATADSSLPMKYQRTSVIPSSSSSYSKPRAYSNAYTDVSTPTVSTQSFAQSRSCSSVFTEDQTPTKDEPKFDPLSSSFPSDNLYAVDGKIKFAMDNSNNTSTYMVPDFSYTQQPGFWGYDTMHTGFYNYYGLPINYSMQEPSQDVVPQVDSTYMGFRRTSSLRDPPKSAINKRPARKHFTPEVTNILKTWFKENSHRPYPSEETKQELLMQTGLTMNQLSNWFINARRRNWRRSRVMRE